MDYERQRDLVNQRLISTLSINIIGCGALGSAVAMALSKMGVRFFYLFDDDGVTEVNLPNQMYRIKDLNKFKVDALSEIIKEYNDEAVVVTDYRRYTHEPLQHIVIVTTDSMSSRRAIWEQFCIQPQTRTLIEARMGAEEGQTYTIQKINTSEKNYPHVTDGDRRFYEERLYTDEQAKPLPCTAKAIIYNVFMIASLVCRAYKAVIEEKPFPREVVMGMAEIHKYSFQVRE